MNTDNIQATVDNELCFGCGSCQSLCPSQAIQMKFSALGRLLPSIDEGTCTHCGLCLKACPGIDVGGELAEADIASLMGNIDTFWFAKSTNKTIFDNAQSGGGVTETLSYLFDTQRIDAALVVGQERHKAAAKVVTEKSGLLSCQSSQYTPVSLDSELEALANYEHVAVVGLPCHIEGITKLKKAFPDKYSNIVYLIGLICAGTLAQSCVEVTKNIGEPEIGEIKETDTIYWRSKKYSDYKRSDIAIVGIDDSHRILDNHIRHLAKHQLTAPRCRLCFDKMNLFSDITFGDCWGVSGEDTKDGGNVILCRTAESSALIAEMAQQGRLSCRPCTLDEIKHGQGLSQKKNTVEKMLSVYRAKGLQTPGWAKAFTASATTDKQLTKEVDDYMARDNGDSAKAVDNITAKVKKQLFFKKITGKIRKAIGK